MKFPSERRSGREAEGNSLENYHTGNGIVSSNLTSSAQKEISRAVASGGVPPKAGKTAVPATVPKVRILPLPQRNVDTDSHTG